MSLLSARHTVTYSTTEDQWPFTGITLYAWWQRYICAWTHTYVNNSPNVVSWHKNGQELNSRVWCLNITPPRRLIIINNNKSHVSSVRDGHFFVKRIVNVWNSLPDCIVMSNSVVAFRQKLKQLHFFPIFVILEIHIVVYIVIIVFMLIFRAHVKAVSLPLSPASIHSLYVVDFFVLPYVFQLFFFYILCWQINLIWFEFFQQFNYISTTVGPLWSVATSIHYHYLQHSVARAS